MDESGLRVGTTVRCSDDVLGVLENVQGSAQSPLLAIRPADNATANNLILVPASYVARADDQAIYLSIPCDEARQLTTQGQSNTVSGLAQDTNALRIPVVEEQLIPTTRWTEAGALEIARTTRTETQELDVPVRYEAATVEHMAVNRVLADNETPATRQEGATLIVPVVREELVVTKRRILVEELHITKQVQTRTEHVSGEVQRQEVTINHPGLEAQQPSS